MTVFYVRSRPTTTWATGITQSLGDRVIATSSTAYLGIHFECTTAGTTGGTEPTWNATIGGTTSDGSVTWTTRGSASIWAASASYALGDRVVSTTGASASAQRYVYECTTAGTSGGSQPTFVTSVGSTTTDNTVTWTTRNCTTWDNATTEHRRLFNIADVPTNGDIVYIGKAHAETSSAAVSIAYPTASSTPIYILCIDDTGSPTSPTTLATTATIATTGASNFTMSGMAYIYGIKFTAGSGANAAHLQIAYTSVNSNLLLDSCLLEIAGTTSTNTIKFGAVITARSWVRLVNTPLKFAATGHSVDFAHGDFVWESTASAIQGTVPTTLFNSASASYGGPRAVVKGVDFSAMGSGNSMVKLGTFHSGSFHFYDCRLGASAAWTTGTAPGSGSFTIRSINCDSSSANYRVYSNAGGGVLTDESTLVMTGGASDGATPLSWKIVTDANATWAAPFISLPVQIWNDTTGASKTATVEFLHDSATNLTDAEVWIEVEYLGSSSYPVATTISDRKSGFLTTAADQSDSSATWTTTGMTNPNTQKLNVTFTPQMKGFIIARVFVAKASKTLYVNPQITLS